MGEKVSGFDFWELRFGEDGDRQAGAQELLAELPGTGATDLFVFSHGWNNDRPRARRLYERFFGEMRKLVAEPGKVATAGVIWPSMRWVDETDPEAGHDEGGAAGASDTRPRDPDVVAALADVFPGKQGVLDALGALLDERPQSQDELARFQELMGELTTAADDPQDEEDNQERALLDAPPRDVFGSGARQARRRGGEGAAGFDDGGGATDLGGAAALNFGRLWEGAKQALRQATYWEMKKRAGVVGAAGLGPLLLDLHERDAGLRIHLIGHSFGARVVSFALRGLGDDPPSPSPVKSVFLVQGAFSHYAFAEKLPHDPARSGGLHGMQQRVDGPLVVTHSVHDDAVGRAYPVASLAAGQDAADVADWMMRWGAIGHSGALAVDAAAAPLGAAGTAYTLAQGRFLNLDGDEVIKQGDPPSGAHSDIFHPQLAWAALSAAGLT
jgi:hypothetical protein